MADFDAEMFKQLRDIIVATGQQREAGNTPYVVVPQDHKVVGLSDYVHNDRSERPIRKQGIVKVFDTDSFCEYYSLFSDEDSRVFADECASTVLAILDYHEKGAAGPRWGEHRIHLSLRPSDEWTKWTGKNGVANKMSQMDFAEFIEDNSPDIVQPSGATMLEVARTLSAKTDVDFASAIRMANGSVQLKYNEQVKGTYGNGQVDIPEQFTIAVPVYLGLDRTPITARLRYRIASGKITFWYDLLRPEAVKRDAFLAIRDAIQQRIARTIINGTPA